MIFIKYLIIVLLFLISFYTDASLTTSSIASNEELKNFFKDTYMEKMSGAWDKKRNAYAVPGFISGWEMFHLHHACVRGGSDGVYVGVDGVENDWSGLSTQNKKIMSPEEWKKYATIRGLSGFFLQKVSPSNSINVTMKYGSVWLMNCFHQFAKASNPAHWMMKLGGWYEIALCQSDFSSANIFQNPIKLPYDHVQLLQCSSPELSDWKWGQTLWDIVKARSDLAGMTGPETSYENIGYDTVIDETQLLCFEDIYFSARMGLWMQGRRNLVEFRRDTASITSEPSEALTRPEILTIDDKGFDTTSVRYNRMHYCPTNPAYSRTSARIKIFHRTATVMLRRFINLWDVVNLAQSYTTVPVEVITVNETTSVRDQIRLFNTFDVLITSHGSHLANGLFTMFPETKAVIEIVPFVFDSVFYGNYNHWLGFADYILSTGHLTPGLSVAGKQCHFSNQHMFKKHNCSITKHNYPDRLEQSWSICNSIYHTRGCDTLVDIKILKLHMDTLFSKVLCTA